METVVPIESEAARLRSDAGSTVSDVRERLRASDRGALAELYDAYARRIYGLALWWTGRPEEAEDVVQETFVRAWEKRRLLARARDLEAYLLRMAKMVAAGRHRRRRPSESLDNPALDKTRLVWTVDSDPARRVDAERLSRCLHDLSPKLRSVVYLHGFLDHSFRQVGSILGIPTFTAASRYRLAVEKLRSLMEVTDVH